MKHNILGVYNQLPVQWERGDGAWLFDTKGNKYLDAYCGIAVTGLGHNYPPLTKFITEQAAKVLHCSNVVEIAEQQELSNVLIDAAGFAGRVFFSNSGAEAVEALVKLARLYGHSKNIKVPKILVFDRGFHGRTLAAIFASASPKVQEGFTPPVEGFVRVAYDDPKAVEDAISRDKDIAAVLVEPVQGEGGVWPPSANYLRALREICDKHQVMLMADEIQCGMGRTGQMFCYQHDGIVPDAVSLAKGLANGLAIGANLIREPYHELFKPGSHGSTFGGNPLSCGAGVITVNEITKHKYHHNAAVQGEKIINAFRENLTGVKGVVDIRGKGLMIGVQLDRPCRDILYKALERNIIFNVANGDTVRMLPPLILNDQQTQYIIDVVPELIRDFLAA